MRKIFRFLLNRLTIITLFVLLQIFTMIYLLFYFKESYSFVAATTVFFEFAIIIDLVNRDMFADLKLPWLAVVMLVPIAGVIIYILFSKNNTRRKDINKLNEKFKEIQSYVNNFNINPSVLNEYEGQSNYIKNTCSSGLYDYNKTKYFECGEQFFESYLEDLRNAKKYIFLEYFIFDNGIMLDKIVDVLKQKVKENVEVRIMYDDLGCINKIKSKKIKELKSSGIKCIRFNPFIPIVSSTHNNRNHRKITVIDGIISYTGGINIADEYINVKKKYGYWKDSAIRIEGKASKQFTVFFLQLCSLQKNIKEDYSKYINDETNDNDLVSNGFVQPFCDGPNPLFPDLISENIILNMINQANESINITTPYLIIDSVMKNSLINAVKRGVKVNIFLPHIPDKKLIFILSRCNCMEMLKNNVNIYEYEPGFLHAKNYLVDNKIAVVGSANLDYRSLVHNYECGVWMYNTSSITEIKNDFDDLIKDSLKIDMKKVKIKWYEKLIYQLLSIFSPLL